MKINTNIASLNGVRLSSENSRNLSKSLERLSSGLRINKAADDGSGLAIANSLKSQASAISQSIKNANDAVGIIQIADKAMDEQLKILDSIKTKATQASTDSQSKDTRLAIQKDITKLIDSLDNIAKGTSYNGQTLLDGSFTNKKFQVGAYSNQSIDFSINSTQSSKVGNVRFETTTILSGTSTLTFNKPNSTITLESVDIGTLKVGSGIGALADTINKNSDNLEGVKASWSNQVTGSNEVRATTIENLKINNISIGTVDSIEANDRDGKLVNAINSVSEQTGVEAFTDSSGAINFKSLDGRGVVVSATAGLADIGLNATGVRDFGRLTLSRFGSKDISLSDSGGVVNSTADASTTLNLANVKSILDRDIASAIGSFANQNIANRELNIGVTTLSGAMAIMEVADSAMQELNQVRSNIGSNQNSFLSTVNNISVTKVNVKASESQIRDTNFALESATFQRNSILSQSGSYALSQANQIPKNIQKLLQ